MTSIYEAFDKATARTAAYAVLSAEGGYVGRVVFCYPRDGAGRLTCYLHIHGSTMVKGTASGCGYDKHSAAVESAVAKLTAKTVAGEATPDAAAHIACWRDVLRACGGHYWYQVLERIGYRVVQVC